MNGGYKYRSSEPSGGSLPTSQSNSTDHCRATAMQNKRMKYDAQLKKPVLILGRRYALTACGSKYLDVGVKISGPGKADTVIVIGCTDNSNFVEFSQEGWQEFMDFEDNVDKFFKNVPAPSHYQLADENHVNLTEAFENKKKLVRFSSENSSVAVAESTVNALYKLRNCVDLMIEWLNENVPIATEVFDQFTSIARNANDIKNLQDLIDAIHRHEYYRSGNLVQCEVLFTYIKDIYACAKDSNHGADVRGRARLQTGRQDFYR